MLVLYCLLAFIFEPKLTYDSLLALAAGGAIFLLNWARVTYKRNHTFDLQYPEGTYRDPGNMAACAKGAGGKGSTLLRVQVRSPLDIKRLNVRFVKTAKGGNVPQSVITIEDLRDADYDASTMPSKEVYWSTTKEPDGDGGYTRVYVRPMFKAQNEFLWLLVRYHAKQQWEGFISFQGYDNAGNRRYSRRHFIVPEEVDNEEG